MSESARAGELIAQKYRVVSLLGEGGMGVVLLAVHEPLGAMVAVKVLSQAGRTPADEKRFLFEAQAAAQLKSPHVAHVTDFGSLPDGRQYMVMEHLEGEDLGARLKRGRVPVSEAADFLIQACAGLAEAHASGIVHRDIKPSNLFVTRTNDGSETIKVLDFGVSKFQLASGGQHVLTSTGLAVGTPLYMSPEQVHGKKQIDARSDVWSLGVVLYELCAGKSPFYDDSLGLTLLNVLERPHPTLRNSGVDLSADLERIVDSCLSKDPAGRPATVAELAASLAPFATDEGKRLAARIPAISKRASSRVQVALPQSTVEDRETLRVAVPTSQPDHVARPDDSGASSKPAYTPQPGEQTRTVLLARSRFTIPVAVGVGLIAIVSVILATSLRAPAASVQPAASMDPSRNSDSPRASQSAAPPETKTTETPSITPVPPVETASSVATSSASPKPTSSHAAVAHPPASASSNPSPQRTLY